MEKKIVNVLLMIVVLFLIAINIMIFKNNNVKKSEENTPTQNEAVEEVKENVTEEINNTVVTKIADMGERKRMQTYFGSFIQYIEGKNYESAYKLLNESFKNSYFPKLSDFEEYMQKYPEEPVVDYENIERQGELFVLTVSIKDVFDSTFQPISQKVVIRELGLNEFTLSFQVE